MRTNLEKNRKKSMQKMCQLVSAFRSWVVKIGRTQLRTEEMIIPKGYLNSKGYLNCSAVSYNNDIAKREKCRSHLHYQQPTRKIDFNQSSK